MIRYMTAFVLATAVAVPMMAQTASTTNMDILRQKIKADKKLVVAQNLKLTDAEGANFWPIYDAYQKDLQQINERLAKAILAYADAYDAGPVTNEKAKQLLDQYIAVDDAEAKLRAATTPKVLDAPPPCKGGTLFPDREQNPSGSARYELAAAIPLIE